MVGVRQVNGAVSQWDFRGQRAGNPPSAFPHRGLVGPRARDAAGLCGHPWALLQPRPCEW